MPHTKRLRALCVLLALCLVLCLSAACGEAAEVYAVGESFEEDGFIFRVLDETYLEITEYSGSASVVTVPAQVGSYSVMSVADSVFEAQNITSAILSEGIMTIGERCFASCSYLKSVVLPESLISIGSGCFYNCLNLSSVNIPQKLAEIPQSCFEGCAALTCVMLPDTVASIGARAFASCDNLAQLGIPQTLKRADYQAFSLTAWIGAYDSQEFVIIGDGVLVAYNGKGGNVKIPDTVKYIGGAFLEYEMFFDGRLKSVTVPESVEYIGARSFKDSGLRSITFKGDIKGIGEGAFAGCTSLSSLRLRGTFTAIPQSMCENCTALTSVTLPGSVSTIEADAFSGCKKLRKINLDNVQNIAEGAFSGSKIKA